MTCYCGGSWWMTGQYRTIRFSGQGLSMTLGACVGYLCRIRSYSYRSRITEQQCRWRGSMRSVWIKSDRKSGVYSRRGSCTDLVPRNSVPSRLPSVSVLYWEFMWGKIQWLQSYFLFRLSIIRQPQSTGSHPIGTDPGRRDHSYRSENILSKAPTRRFAGLDPIAQYMPFSCLHSPGV